MISTFTKNTFFIITVLFVNVFTSDAQDTSNTIGKVSISSPTAASLGKYGDIPVSYNTGIPNIGLPIYTAKSGKLSLPISLSYHASGLKVQEQASWVGAGWSLNAGGVITRTVVGAADDRGFASYSNVTNGYYSDTGYDNYLFIPGSGFGATADGKVPDDLSFEEGYKDGEPDLYFFNFGNYSGKFYFNDDQTPVIVPGTDLKIVPSYTLGPGFTGFKVVTPDGVQYYFGSTGNTGTVAPIESTSTSTLQNSFDYANAAASSWFLNKIVSADGMDSIKLAYQQENYSYYALSMFPVLSIKYNANGAATCGYNLVKNFVQGVRLSQVSFANGTVLFTVAATPRADLSAGSLTNATTTDVTNTSSYALGSISVNDNNGYCKKDSFSYGYFHDLNSSGLNPSTYGAFHINTDAYKLRLDSVQEISCDGSIKLPPHKFSYFDTSSVERSLSFGIDHWGFFNGVINNTSLVPTFSIVNTSGASASIEQTIGANRDAAWPAMRAGSLQKITYPTGGSTTMDFEPNDTYLQYNNYTKIASGGPSVGYDGTTQTTGTFVVTSVNASIIYEIDISGNITSGSGQLEIYDVNHPDSITNIGYPTVANVFVPVQQFLYLHPGTTYKYIFYKNSVNGSGYGLSSSITQWVPTTVSGNAIVGGLRIKTITNNDGITSANNIVTSYAYTNGSTQSSGILYGRPTYVQIIRNDAWKLVWGPYCSVNGCATCDNFDGGLLPEYYVSPNSIRPMATAQGHHIGYNQVQVTQANNGYSIYRYYGSNVWDNVLSDVCTRSITASPTGVCDASIPNFPPAPEPFEFMRGELKYEGHFNQNGNILKDAWYFPTYKADPLTTPGIKHITIPGLYSFSTYSLQSGTKIKDSVVSTTYDPATGGYLTTKNATYYASAFHHQPTHIVAWQSTGDSLITNIKYVSDFRVASGDAIPDSVGFYTALATTDSLAMLTYISTCTPQTSALNSCRYSGYEQYRRNVNLARIAFINYRRRSYSGLTNLFTTYHNTAKAAADGLLKPILQLQDEYINSPVETSQWKNNMLLHATFNSYDFVTNPAGFVYPSNDQHLNLAAPSSTFVNAVVSGNTITKDNRYIIENSVKYALGNVVEADQRGSTPASYIWDYLNTLPVAKVINATVDQVAYTSFESGKGGWVYAGTTIADITSPTGSYCYNIAGGAISRAGLSNTRNYRVSYWTKNATAYAIAGTVATYPKQGKTVNGWSYFEHKLTGINAVNLSGTGYIDELRIYPDTAQMTTYTYAPLTGMTSQCDVDNRITYYQYDALGRLFLIKDQDKNVLKKICYNYSGVASACGVPLFYNDALSLPYARTNCTGGYTGGTVTYTVPANKYGALTKSAANVLAQNDAAANGPTYANVNGSCTAPALVTLTSANYAAIAGFSAVYTNVSTSVQTTFSIPSTTTTTTLGTLAAGTYNVTVSKPSNTLTYVFSVCTSSAASGTSFTMSNISVSASTCNNITIDTLF